MNLVHLKEDDLFKITIPSKTQAYMAAGRPILMAVDGNAADLVSSSQSGVVAKSGNATSVADAAIQLFRASDTERAAMGENGIAFYKSHLSLVRGVEKFGSIFKLLAN